MENKYNNFVKIMLRRFIPAVVVIIVVATIKHFVLQYYMGNLSSVLEIYDINSTEQLKFIKKIETLSYLFIISLIIFIGVFIFLPTLKGLSKAFYEVKESNENVMKLFKIAHGALFLLNLDTCEIMLMNKEAEKLINTEFKEGININNCFKIKSNDFQDVIEAIKENEHNENMEIELILNDGEKMYAIVTSVKTHFNNKDAILMGLFDISKRKQSEETFKDMAIKDKLTDIYNRNYFEKRVNDKIQEAEKYDEPISMLMLDLDHFKNINDTYGHPIGDEVLKLVAITLKNFVRKSDYLFRVGGEEFVILMTRTDIYAADKVAEKVRLELEKIEHPVAGRITASIGVAEKLKFEKLDDWYKRVDKALYCAKEGGRNCVVNYGEYTNFATAHIVWNKNWESGNNAIDEQHKELIELGNTLIFMNLSNFKSDKILIQLDKLIDHIVEHFKYEENLLKDIGFDNYDEHKEIHNTLLTKASELKNNFISGKINKTTFFSFVVDDVVLEHMVKEDKKFYHHFKNKNKK